MSAGPAPANSRAPSARRGQAYQETAAMQLTERHRQYWQRNLRITGILLGIWFVVTFVVAYFARELSFSFFGWPFSFWVASQGALVIYVVIIGFYAYYMNKLDIECGVAEIEED
jgi:putative solute:sodium symporter small subunit